MKGGHAGPMFFIKIKPTGNVLDKYEQLAQVLLVSSLRGDPNEHILPMYQAMVTFLPEVIKIFQESGKTGQDSSSVIALGLCSIYLTI